MHYLHQVLNKFKAILNILTIYKQASSKPSACSNIRSILFETNKFHHEEPPCSGGPGAIPPPFHPLIRPCWTQALLGRVAPRGWVPVSGMKTRSLVRLSAHSACHRDPPTAPHVCGCCQMNRWVVRRVQMGVSIWGAVRLHSMDGWALRGTDLCIDDAAAFHTIRLC